MRRERTNRLGFTLTELLIAIGLSGIVGLFAARQLWTAIRFSGQTQDSFELDKAKVSVLQELKKVMSRSRRVAATPGLPIDVISTSATPTAAITFAADLRPCAANGAAATVNQFNPLDAAAGGLPAENMPIGVASPAAQAAYTLVTFICCPPITTNLVSAANPFGGGNILTPNRCRTRPGLTINYRRNGVDLGGTCYGNFGPNSGTFTGMRFRQLDLDYSKIRFYKTQLCDSAGNFSSYSYFSTYWCGPGSTPKLCNPVNAGDPGAQNGSCAAGSTEAPSNLYYGSFTTGDTFTTGTDGSGRNNDVLRVAADIATTTEFYGRLENQPSGHLFDCTSGVYD